MAKKALTAQQHFIQRPKPLGLTLSELKREIDKGRGDLRLMVKLKRNPGSFRLIIRCKNKVIPQAWSMAMLSASNVPMDCIDFHVSDYVDTEGIKRIGWHRDLKRNGKTIARQALVDFDPKTLEDFILSGLRFFNVILNPEEGDVDAHGQMRIR